MIFLEHQALSAKLSREARERLEAHAQTGAEDPECAGLLLGRLIAAHDPTARQACIVDAITEPGPRCWGTRFGCHFDGEHHTAQADRAWEESGGTCGVLGHWHTHPEDDPRPSWTDVADWQHRLLVDDWGGLSHVVFAIVGRTTVRAWLGEVRTGALTKKETRVVRHNDERDVALRIECRPV